MKYVWMWMLAAIDVIWLAASIIDVVRTVKFVKNNRRYGSVSDFVDCVIEELEESTTGFIALHLFVLFLVSVIAWMRFKMGGATE